MGIRLVMTTSGDVFGRDDLSLKVFQQSAEVEVGLDPQRAAAVDGCVHTGQAKETHRARGKKCL